MFNEVGPFGQMLGRQLSLFTVFAPLTFAFENPGRAQINASFKPDSRLFYSIRFLLTRLQLNTQPCNKIELF